MLAPMNDHLLHKTRLRTPGHSTRYPQSIHQEAFGAGGQVSTRFRLFHTPVNGRSAPTTSGGLHFQPAIGPAIFDLFNFLGKSLYGALKRPDFIEINGHVRPGRLEDVVE